MEDYPENHRVRWTNRENIQLYKEVNNRIDLETIAKNHKRTIGAIKYKLIRYAIEMAETDETLTMQDLCNKTNLSRKILIEGFKKLKYDYDLEDIYPENHGNVWTDKEIAQLHNQIKEGVDLETIANKHKRTYQSIKYKLINYAIEMSEKDKLLTIEDLSNMTSLSCEDLIEGFNNFNYTHFNTTTTNEIESYLIKFIKIALCIVAGYYIADYLRKNK